MTIKELKIKSKQQLKGKWGKATLLPLMFFGISIIITQITSKFSQPLEFPSYNIIDILSTILTRIENQTDVDYVTYIISLALMVPLMTGISYYFLKLPETPA